MSNRLRRYSLYAPYGPQADEAGAWVEAEEAKARIRELESALSGAQAEIAALTQPETGQQQTSDGEAGTGNGPPSHGESTGRVPFVPRATDPPERGSTPTPSEEPEADK